MPVSFGAGTDIFIRKAKPGAAVGVGYYVDVYLNGVKIESTRIDTKKHVINMINSYKEKYHTDRAFKNEEQLHITYKTKQERGEVAMQSLDQEILKKASRIHRALQKLITPDIPIKIREAELAGLEGLNPQNVNLVPETPGGPQGAMSEQQIGTMIASKFVDFVTKNKPQQPGEEWVKEDDLYNPLKKWLTAIKKKLTEYQQANAVKLDMTKIADAAEGIVLSGDPNKLSSATKMAVEPDIAAKIKEIASMKAGIRKPLEGPPAPAPVTANEDEMGIKVAADMNEEQLNDVLDTLDKKAEETNPKDPGPSPKDAGPDPKDAGPDPKDPKHENESVKSESGVQSYGQNRDNDTLEPVGVMRPSEERVKEYVKSFWEFAQNLNRIATLENAFEDWCNKEKLDLHTAGGVWTTLNSEIKEGFDKKAWSNLSVEEIDRIVKERFLLELGTTIAQYISKIGKVNVDYSDELSSRVIQENPSAIQDLMYKLTAASLYEYEQRGIEITYDLLNKILDKGALDSISAYLESNDFFVPLTREVEKDIEDFQKHTVALGEEPPVVTPALVRLTVRKTIDKSIKALSIFFNTFKEKFKVDPSGLKSFLRKEPEEPAVGVESQTEPLHQ
ncbi:MAG TPA: hypothetical protein P5136_00325 [Methanofastidiosum sp.]|nr:hypothetical protein [Methanofastidiosum sp.]